LIWKIYRKNENSGVQGKNNEYHIVDKVQNSYENTLIFDLIDNVVFVVFALYSRIWKTLLNALRKFKIFTYPIRNKERKSVNNKRKRRNERKTQTKKELKERNER
jgi:hypothetical protein